MIESIRLLARGFGEIRAARREDDAGRRVDDETSAVRIAAVLDCRLDIAALRPDPGNQERNLRCDCTNAADLLRIRRADNEPAVLVFVPGTRDVVGDLQVERNGLGLQNPKILKLAGAGIRRTAEDEDPLFRIIEERLNRFPSEIGMNRYRIALQMVEDELAVALIRIADIAALGVDDDGNIGRDRVDVVHRALERKDACIAEGFVECRVRLVGADQVEGRVDDISIEFEEFLRDVAGLEKIRQLVVNRIESDAEELPFGPFGREKPLKVSIGHRSPLKDRTAGCRFREHPIMETLITKMAACSRLFC